MQYFITKIYDEILTTLFHATISPKTLQPTHIQFGNVTLPWNLVGVSSAAEVQRIILYRDQI